jgi:hypothetical protein
MMIAMLVAGVVCLLAGALAIGFGIPVNEFSFGNTMILAGAMAASAGLIILSMWVSVRELKSVAGRLALGPARDREGHETPAVGGALPRPADRGDEVADVAETSSSAPPTVPWQEDAAARDRPRNEVAQAPESPPTARQRRNLMFSSSSRRERERAQARAADESTTGPHSATPADAGDVPPPAFDDAWPKSERSRPVDPSAQRRAGRNPSTFGEPAAARQPAVPPAEDQPAVTVLKSGVVDGMAYSLYSDGSIEAQMPEGMMRFASIGELRAHLDQRP